MNLTLADNGRTSLDPLFDFSGKIALVTGGSRGHAAAPEEILTAALFLASPASVNVTGSLVRCDGGQH